MIDRIDASHYDGIYLEGFKHCFEAICLHLPLESLQDAGWQEFVDVQKMIEARKEYTKELSGGRREDS